MAPWLVLLAENAIEVLSRLMKAHQAVAAGVLGRGADRGGVSAGDAAGVSALTDVSAGQAWVEQPPEVGSRPLRGCR